MTQQQPIGLVTGFEPFAGLPSNPAERVLPALDGMEAAGIRVHPVVVPVSLARAPAAIAALVEEHRPAFVLSLGLASGAPSPRVEMMAINAAAFSVPDNDGFVATGERPFPAGPTGRAATWDGAAVVAAIEAEGIPARLSFHAGTHLCNAALYVALQTLESLGLPAPCGFLHLPYMPEQVVWRRRNGTPAADDPSMALEIQVSAVKAAIREMAHQANGVRMA